MTQTHFTHNKITAVEHILFIIFAVIAVGIIAIQTPVNIQNKSDLYTVECGWPLTFIIDDQSWRDPPYPWTTTCRNNEWGSIPEVLWSSFFINVTIFYLFFMYLLNLYRWLQFSYIPWVTKEYTKSTGRSTLSPALRKHLINVIIVVLLLSSIIFLTYPRSKKIPEIFISQPDSTESTQK